MKKIYRYSVPVDGGPHTLELRSDPLKVEAVYVGAGEYEVDFWAEYDPGWPVEKRTFQVFGTGPHIQNDAKYWGTCQRINGMVWHLYEV